MSSLAEVRLWGRRIGAVELAAGERAAVFEYEPEFAASGIELAPVEMPGEPGRRYVFPQLAEGSFAGLPGLLADSLPDRWGNALIDAWLARHGRAPESFDPVERLCYIGSRGMGALEFRPALGPDPTQSHEIDVAALTELAETVMAGRAELAETLDRSDQEEALQEILRVGSSAGGARAKALIALDPETDEVRSGQLDAPGRFQHWILKFDGAGEQTRELAGGGGYGVIEWVYSELAKLGGIEMTECRILAEGERRHFMTRRFDRTAGGGKLHMQSLAALLHLDFNQAGAHSYEQAFALIRRLGLPMTAIEEQFRRMAFNVVARNQDDHVKNIAFLMDRAGDWTLAPAFDLTYAYNPDGTWTAAHQMTLNDKRGDFDLADFKAAAGAASMKRGRAETILTEVTEAVRRWPELAARAGVEGERVEAIAATHRLNLAVGHG